MCTLLINAILLLFIVPVFSGCAALKNQNGASDYFPINEGAALQYHVERTRHRFQYVKVTFEYSITTLPSRTLDSREVVPFRYNNGNLVFISKDEKGVYYLAEQLRGDTNPVLLPVPRLVYPRPLLPGTEFRETWQSSLTENEYDVDIVFTVLQGYEDVEVPAGRFTRCLQIKGEGRSVLPDGNTFSLELHDWVCPGVGNVKEILEESSTVPVNGAPDGGRQVTTLTSIN